MLISTVTDELIALAPADLNGFLRALRRALKKHGLEKEKVQLCYEVGPTRAS